MLQQLLVHEQLAHLGLELVLFLLQGLNLRVLGAPLEPLQARLQEGVAPLRQDGGRLPRLLRQGVQRFTLQ